MMSVVDLRDVREATLQRVRESIEELERVLASASQDNSSRDLLKALIRHLRQNEQTLAAGLTARRAREN